MKLCRPSVFILAGLVVLAASGFEAKAEDKTYVNIVSTPGESTDGAHGGWIDAYALELEAVRVFASGGGGTGAPDFKDVSILKGTDKASPLLNLALALNTNLGLVTIDVCRTTAPQQCYFKVELTNSMLSGVSLSGSSCVGTGACTPTMTESVSFHYTRIRWTYIPFTGGTPGTPVVRCYDLASGQSC
jgi:type VI secretion system Hcp family effector